MEQSVKDSEEQHNVFTLRAFVSIIFRHWKRIFQITFAVGIITVLYLLFIASPVFKATTTLLPKIEDNASLNALAGNLSGLASGLGLKEEEILMYPDIVLSRRLLEPILLRKYATNQFPDSVPLLVLLGFEFDSSETGWYEETMQKALKVMEQDVVEANVDRKTSLITISASIPDDANLSAEVANLLAENLGYYNRYVKKTQASEQLSFVEERSNQVNDDLKKSEEELRMFREQNRKILDSPLLLLEEARLRRTVELNQAVFIELRTQLELIKLEVIKNTPVINVLDAAKPPAKKFKPRRILITLVVVFCTFFTSGFYFYYREYRETFRERIFFVLK